MPDLESARGNDRGGATGGPGGGGGGFVQTNRVDVADLSLADLLHLEGTAFEGAVRAAMRDHEAFRTGAPGHAAIGAFNAALVTANTPEGQLIGG